MSQYGEPATGETRAMAGNACIRLCAGDKIKARGLWHRVASRCGGSVTRSAAMALDEAAKAIVPDVGEPDLTKW